MSDRPSKIVLAVLLASATIGVSTHQRTAPAAQTQDIARRPAAHASSSVITGREQ